ncbi:hypothetical protein D910_12180 [Dendroctonus ponderosae]|uniref:Uncharacterized protein n=1 Tax=Dendroctonus ponderosae TaxID=77166 RepID=U4UP74_DENPD|nr:hypothetical protein D910_12180 [Dendroctonus ponderosae]
MLPPSLAKPPKNHRQTSNLPKQNPPQDDKTPLFVSKLHEKFKTRVLNHPNPLIKDTFSQTIPNPRYLTPTSLMADPPGITRLKQVIPDISNLLESYQQRQKALNGYVCVKHQVTCCRADRPTTIYQICVNVNLG